MKKNVGCVIPVIALGNTEVLNTVSVIYDTKDQNKLFLWSFIVSLIMPTSS